MRASPWSLALLMIVLGVSLGYFARQQGFDATPTTYVVAGSLIGAGLLTLLSRPFAMWLALAAGLLTIGASVASYPLHRDLVPTPPITALMGLLVTARVLLARGLERRARDRAVERAEQQREDDAG